MTEESMIMDKRTFVIRDHNFNKLKARMVIETDRDGDVDIDELMEMIYNTFGGIKYWDFGESGADETVVNVYVR